MYFDLKTDKALYASCVLSLFLETNGQSFDIYLDHTLMTNRVPDEQLTPETLERYVLSRLAPSAREAVEVHLLLCHWCLTALERETEFIAALKLALQIQRELGECTNA